MQTRSVGAGMAAVLVIAIVALVLIEISVRGMQTGRPRGRCKATWKREFKLPWRETGAFYHHDEVDSDQWVVNQELSLDKAAVLVLIAVFHWGHWGV